MISRHEKLLLRLVPLGKTTTLLGLLLSTFCSGSVLASTVTLSPSGNDQAAFTYAIGNCNGGTIIVTAGTYQVGNLPMPNNCTITGQGNPVLKATKAPIFEGSSSNSTIQGLTLNGGGIGGDTATNLQVLNNIIENIADVCPCDAAQGMMWARLQNVTITGNTFLNININVSPYTLINEGNGGGNGILAWEVSNTTISGNTFDTVTEAIHFPPQNYGGYDRSSAPAHPGIVISGNTFLRIHRMPIEIQLTYSDDLIVSDNAMSLWNVPYWNSFCISDASNGTNQQIINNICDYTGALANGLPLEIMGQNMTVSGNVVESTTPLPKNTQYVAATGYTTGTVSGNTFCGVNQLAPPITPNNICCDGLAGPNRLTITSNVQTPTCGTYVQPKAGAASSASSTTLP